MLHFLRPPLLGLGPFIYSFKRGIARKFLRTSRPRFLPAPKEMLMAHMALISGEREGEGAAGMKPGLLGGWGFGDPVSSRLCLWASQS